MNEILEYLFANLNGVTETMLLFILIFYDTFLGGKWRKKQRVARTSGGGLGGLRKSIPLAFTPLIIWFVTVFISILPTHVGGRDVIYSPVVFDFISFFVTITIGSYLLKSIFANMRLAGMRVPRFIQDWIEDEYHVKLKTMEKEPNSAQKERENNNVK